MQEQEKRDLLTRLAEGAHKAGNASVAANPSDPAHFMLFDGHTTTPVVDDEDCYICQDPEFAQMGMPLCSFCPGCLRTGERFGHIPADDTVCTVCGFEHGPQDYDQRGFITGLPPEIALAAWQAAHPGKTPPS
jgi:hypothetical protein